ncbi:MAG: hypothetical protein AMXMBFR84_50000 [Candidatus Hydrogenedentota bacterium]
MSFIEQKPPFEAAPEYIALIDGTPIGIGGWSRADEPMILPHAYGSRIKPVTKVYAVVRVREGGPKSF